MNHVRCKKIVAKGKTDLLEHNSRIGYSTECETCADKAR